MEKAEKFIRNSENIQTENCDMTNENWKENDLRIMSQEHNVMNREIMLGKLGKKYQPLLKYQARKCNRNLENIQIMNRGKLSQNWKEIHLTANAQEHNVMN